MQLREIKRKFLLLCMTALLSACVSMEQIAPPVETFTGQLSGTKRSQLQQGRTIYLTKCAKCHSPEPVHRYSSSRWDEILPEMIDESKLDSAESAAVRAYVYAALRS